MLYINGNTGEREEVTGHVMNPEVGTVVCEFTIGGDDMDDPKPYKVGFEKEDKMEGPWKLEVYSVQTGQLISTMIRQSYVDIIRLENTFTTDELRTEKTRACPECGFDVLRTPQGEKLCLNIPECTWSKVPTKAEDYTTAL